MACHICLEAGSPISFLTYCQSLGLDPAVADLIGEYVKLNGGMDLVEKLKNDERLVKNKDAKEAIDEMTLLLQVTPGSIRRFCQVLGRKKVVHYKWFCVQEW